METLTAYLERLTVSRRMLGFAVLAIVAVLAVGLSIFPQLRSLAQINSSFYHYPHSALSTVKDMQYELLRMRHLLRDLMREENPEKREQLSQDLVDSDARFFAEVRSLSASYAGDQQDIAQAQTLYEALVAYRTLTLDLLQKGAPDAARRRALDSAPGNPGPLLAERLEQISRASSASALTMHERALDIYQGERQQAIVFVAACLVVLLLSALIFARSITLPLRRLRDSIVDLCEGKLGQEIPYQDQQNEIGEIGRGVAILQNVYQAMAAQRWIRTNIAAISGEIQQAGTFTELARKLIDGLGPLLGAVHGAFFIVTEDRQTLKRIASYGARSRYDPAVIRFDGGLVGQCAREGKQVLVGDCPGCDVLTPAEPGETAAEVVMLVPVMRSGRSLAVIELAAAKLFSDDERAVLDGLLPIVAMSLEIIERSTRTRRLLEATQEQAAQLEKQASELAALEEHSRLILGSVSDGILGLDVEGRMIFANPAVLALLGFRNDELLGAPFHERAHYAYADGTVFPYALCPMHLTSFDGQARKLDNEVLWRKDGTPVLVEYATTPFYKADALVGTVVVLRDITERRAAEERLRQAHEEQVAIFATASLGIAFIKDGAFVRVNRRLEELLAYGSDELIGQATGVCLPPDDESSEWVRNLGADLRRGEIVKRVMELQRKDGSRFWCRISGRAVDAGKLSQGTVWMFEDVTKEREAAAAMQRSKELAEETTRMKSGFLANMSHEIRTPMNAIIGMSHLVLKTDLTPRQRDYVRKIQDSGQHLLGIVNDVLDFSKVEAGKLTVEQTEFALEEVLDNVANLIIGKASAKGLELIFDVDPEVPSLLIGDPLRLGQVLINYANNAVKFTERGEVEIRVSVRESVDDRLLLHFAVRDTGIGLTEEHIGRLFRSFSQADISTTRRFGGTGLGLAISKKLVDLMDGEVGVRSELGKGSTFWFTAYLGRAAQVPRMLLPSPDLRGRRVLVVDDNDSARAVIRDLLKAMTFVVSDVSSGKAAVAAVAVAASENPYEIVFLDWLMPGMDGVETARQILALGLVPAPHLVIITADSSEDLLAQATAVGVRDVLLKPVNASLLFDSIIRLIGGAPGESPGPLAAPPLVDPMLAAIAGAHVLLVEDNELNQEVARELLVAAGLVVDLAADGEAAVRKVRAGSYDVVLMDMQMPVMDGVTATLAIRKLAEHAELPIVAMTANAMPADRSKCLAAGMVDFVAKPIDPKDLWRALLKWVKPKHPEPLPAAGPEATALPEVDLDIPGLDTANGLRRVLGKKELYLSMLRKFAASQQHVASEIVAALDAGDWSSAERLAHTLKSVAANIGAGELKSAAGLLETAISERQERIQVDGLLASAATLLGVLIETLVARLPSAANGEVAAAVDPLRLRRVCRDLAVLLAESDAEAGDLLDAEAALLRTAFGAGYWSLETAVRHFDYEAGLAALQANTRASGIAQFEQG